MRSILQTSWWLFLLCALVVSACGNRQSTPKQTIRSTAQLFREKQLIFTEDFSEGLNQNNWIVEVDPQPNSSVAISNGRLTINTAGGATVWLNKILKGDVQIEYIRKVIVNNGVNDRLSDLNQFWMAQTTEGNAFFTRNGRFEEYDDLALYYVGVGGNSNTTTRFRKYSGNGERKLLGEHTDRRHLLNANQEYAIKITVVGNTTSFFVDGERYFSYVDSTRLHQGYFGFRSTYSHQTIDNVRIFQLGNPE